MSNITIKDIHNSDIWWDKTIRLSFLSNGVCTYQTALSSSDYTYSDNKMFTIFLSQIVRNAGTQQIPDGKYTIKLSFDDNWSKNDIFIKEISPSGTEIRIGIDAAPDKQWIQWCYAPSELLNSFKNVIYIKGHKYRIVNVVPDYLVYRNKLSETQQEIDRIQNEIALLSTSTNDYQTLLKGYQDRIIELQKTINNNVLFEWVTFICKLDKAITDYSELPITDCFITEEVANDIVIDDIYVYEEIIINDIIEVNSTPNITVETSPGKYKNWNILISSSYYDIISNLSQSTNLAVNELGIDYSSFSNHVYFGSAVSKVNNMYTKIRSIFDYKTEIQNLTSSDSYTTRQHYSNLIADIENTMTQYERAVYTKSASFAWPKSGSVAHQSLNYHYTSSIVIEWIDSQIESASAFDKNNQYAIINLLPENVINNDTNRYLIDLVYLWGEFFDDIKAYIDQVKYLYCFDYDNINSVPKELFDLYAKNFGWELFEGYDYEEILPYLIGNSYIPTKAVTQEKWLRLLYNIPYLNKVIGTRRAVDAILNIYGIPSTIITLKEYGGSKASGSDYVIDEFNTYCLNFYGGETIYLPQNVYQAISASDFTYEMRFKTTSSIDDMILFGNSGFYVGFDSDNVYEGIGAFISGSKVLTTLSSSTNTELTDGYWTNIALVRDLSASLLYLYLKRYYEGQLFYDVKVSCSLDATQNAYLDKIASTVYFGGKDINGSFSGALQEIRIWNQPLSENEINHHAFDFNSIACTNPDNIADYLVAHYKLCDNKNLLTSPFVNDYSRMPKYDASASVFTGNQYANVNISTKTIFDNFVLEGWSDNKINIGYFSSSIEEVPNRVDLLFSPTKEMNRDILQEFAMYDFNNSIGQPSEMYNDSYQVLDTWRKNYFHKFINNYNLFAYIKFIENFDRAVFKIVKTVLPERVNLVTGLVIEPHLLERNKYKWKKARIEDLTWSTPWQTNQTCSIQSEIEFGVSDIAVDKGTDFLGEYNEFNDSITVTSSVTLCAEKIAVDTNEMLQGVHSLFVENLSFETKVTTPNAVKGLYSDYEMPKYEPISSTITGSAYIPIYKQIKYATINGTQNTPETDYAGAPWEVSQSAATIIRVI